MILENTVQEVHRRILKLVGHKGSINETLSNIELYPHVNPEELSHLEDALSDFLGGRGISMKASEAVDNDGVFKVLPYGPERIKEQLSILTQDKLNMTERAYRLSSKVLKETRDYSDPCHTLKNVLFALGLSQDNRLVVPTSNDISKLISATRKADAENGKILCAFLNDSLDLLKAAYDKATSQKSNGNIGMEYLKHLNGILGKAGKICEEHEASKRYDAEKSARELVDYTREILGLNAVAARRYSEKPLRNMTEDNLLKRFKRGADENSLGELEYECGGALVAVERKANRSTGRLGFTLTFRNETGAVNSVSVNLGSCVGKEPLDLVYYHLIPRAEENLRGLQPSEKGIFAPKTGRAREYMKHDGYKV